MNHARADGPDDLRRTRTRPPISTMPCGATSPGRNDRQFTKISQRPRLLEMRPTRAVTCAAAIANGVPARNTNTGAQKWKLSAGEYSGPAQAGSWDPGFGRKNLARGQATRPQSLTAGGHVGQAVGRASSLTDCGMCWYPRYYYFQYTDWARVASPLPSPAQYQTWWCRQQHQRETAAGQTRYFRQAKVQPCPQARTHTARLPAW